jgi:putative peptidoglycan lipid II flippase
LQIPVHSLAILFVRLITSMKANSILIWGTTISFALNPPLDYVLKGPLGAAGIALSTSVVYAISLLF